MVEATSAAGSATININPAQNTWQATYKHRPHGGRAAREDFSQAGFVVTDSPHDGGRPFPNSVIPVSRLDPASCSSGDRPPPPCRTSRVRRVRVRMAPCRHPASLPAGGHFTIGTEVPLPPARLRASADLLISPAVRSRQRSACAWTACWWLRNRFLSPPTESRLI